MQNRQSPEQQYMDLVGLGDPSTGLGLIGQLISLNQGHPITKVRQDSSGDHSRGTATDHDPVRRLAILHAIDPYASAKILVAHYG